MKGIDVYSIKEKRYRGEMFNVVQGPVIDIALVPPNHQKLGLLQPIFKQR